MTPLSLGVELEVRRADHRNGIGAGGGGVLGERDRVGGRLRAAVRGDEQASGCGSDDRLEATTALVDREQHGLAVGSEGEHPVEPAPGEEVHVRAEGVEIELVAAVP